jgi:Rrf2 family protein
VRLSKTSAQAALALAFLAQQDETLIIQARQVARHLGIPADSALKILQALARHDIIQSRLGRSGGYRLARPAADISLLQVIEAIDGPINGQVRVDNAPQWIAGGIDLLQAISQQAALRIRQELSQTTIADLVKSNENQPVALAT